MRQLRYASWRFATALAVGFLAAAAVPAVAGDVQQAGSFEILDNPPTALSAPALKGSDPADPMTWSAEIIPRDESGLVSTGLGDIGELKHQLTRADHVAALEAMLYALNELGDGATFVWNRKAGVIGGMVRPTSSFIDAKGTVCRHVVYKLTVANYSRQIEGDACRAVDTGSWQISG